MFVASAWRGLTANFSRFFAQKFEDILKASLEKRVGKDVEQAVEQHKPWPRRFLAFISGGGLKVVPDPDALRKGQANSGGVLPKLRPDMIRRMDDAPKLVNPSGWVSEGRTPVARKLSISLRPISKPAPAHMAVQDDADGSSSSNPPQFPAQESDSPKSTDTRCVVVLDFFLEYVLTFFLEKIAGVCPTRVFIPGLHRLCHHLVCSTAAT